MSIGKEAQLLFSSLLSVLGTDEAARQQFGEGWTRVPLHMLLPWSAQMLSLLDGAQGETLLPLLQVCALQTYSHGLLSSLWNPCLNLFPQELLFATLCSLRPLLLLLPSYASPICCTRHSSCRCLSYLPSSCFLSLTNDLDGHISSGLLHLQTLAKQYPKQAQQPVAWLSGTRQTTTAAVLAECNCA